MALFGGDQETNIVIKARDEATGTIEKVRSSFAQMAGAVFTGTAAYDLLRSSLRTTTNFLIESVKASAQASGEQAIIRQNIINSGQSFDILGPKIKAYSESMVKMGFDDEATASSVSRLLLITGNYTDALKLNHLAMDLAANKNVSLEQATNSLAMVLQGAGAKALMQYGLSFKDGSTATEVLLQLQDKVKGSIENMASSSQGKLNALSAAWGNLKEQVGDAIIGSFTAAIKNGTDLNQVLTFMNQAGSLASAGIYETVQALRLVVDTSAIAVGSLMSVTSVVMGGIPALLGNKKAQNDIANAFKGVKDIGEDTRKTFEGMFSPVKNLADVTNQAAVASSSANGALAGTYGPATSASDAVKKLTDKYTTLKDALVKVRQTAIDELKSLADAHNDATTQATESIASLKKQLSDLRGSYEAAGQAAANAFNRQAQQDKMGIADQVVAEQKKIADLKAQAGMETDPAKRLDLISQLKKEQDAYAANADFIASLGDAVAEAKRKSQLTEFEQAIEDYKAKRAQAEQEYADNRADADREYAARAAEIQLQLAQTQLKLDQENAKYKKAYDEITKNLAIAEAMRLDTSKKTSDQIIALVDKQVDAYNRLADAIQRASQGKAAQVSTSVSLPVREQGGAVPGPIGQPVAILAHGGEQVIPAQNVRRSSGGSNITVNINNPQVRDATDLNLFRSMIEAAFRDITRVHKLTTI